MLHVSRVHLKDDEELKVPNYLRCRLFVVGCSLSVVLVLYACSDLEVLRVDGIKAKQQLVVRPILIVLIV